MKSITYLSALVAILLISLNGCNTFEGMGKDIKAGGQAISNAANDTPPKKTTTVHTVSPGGTEVTATTTTSQ